MGPRHQGAGYGFAVTRDEGIYDWNNLPAGAPSKVLFFTRGLNGRTFADTNLETPGQLPGDREQKIQGLTFFAGYNAAAEADAEAVNADLVALRNFSILTVRVNNNIALRVPTIEAAGGAPLIGQLGGLAAGFTQLGEGWGYLISDVDRFITIPSNATVRVELEWSNDAALPQIQVQRRIGVYLRGPQAFQAGRA